MKPKPLIVIELHNAGIHPRSIRLHQTHLGARARRNATAAARFLVRDPNARRLSMRRNGLIIRPKVDLQE
jgi:hypothetical protein